ncbi:isochorismatase family cysteine hydrolase [Rugamonas sp.]|uniref:isochorismatase family cysteine hydrolase n=1 Tax=Rugamonas sp. TaxID=1926287 RepID=UPI0025DFC7D0|nr:isochorismatase family cysteine hydrolase [Rugamonas sp.]
MNQPRYPARTTALILVDVLNDFLADDGKLHGMIGPMLEQTDLIAQLQRLLAGAREAGVQIFFAPHGQDEHSFDDVPHVHPRLAAGAANQVFWKGSYGAEFFPPLKPRAGEVVISQHRMFDSFIGTDLEQQLRARGIDHVVLAGLTSHTCVEGTGRHALEAGFHVTFIKDGVAEFTEQAHRAAIDISYPTFGHASLTVDEFLAGVQRA